MNRPIVPSARMAAGHFSTVPGAFRLLAAGLFLFGSPLQAAPDPARPAEPLIPPLPARAAWVLQSGAPPADKTAAPDAQDAPKGNRITIAKNGNVFRLVSDQPVGGEREAWVVDGRVFLLVNNDARCVIVDSLSFPAADFSRGEFEHFQWIRMKDFQGVQEAEGRKVFAFEADALRRPLSPRETMQVSSARMSGAGTAEGGSAPPASDADVLQTLGWGPRMRVLLDATTQFPVLLESDAYRLRVQFLPDAPSLVVPEVIRRKIEAIQQEQKILQKRPTKPKR